MLFVCLMACVDKATAEVIRVLFSWLNADRVLDHVVESMVFLGFSCFVAESTYRRGFQLTFCMRH